jgi:hypothetical protein
MVFNTHGQKALRATYDFQVVEHPIKKNTSGAPSRHLRRFAFAAKVSASEQAPLRILHGTLKKYHLISL